MEIITNKYLKRITLNPPPSLYDNLIESPELKEIDNQIEQEAIKTFFQIMISKKEEFSQLYEEFDSEEEKLVIMQFASIQYYFSQKDDSRIREQLNLCENLITSDIGKRNNLILNALIFEAEKLKLALESNFVVFASNFLNELYMKIYPALNKTDRYVRISEFMNKFSTLNTVKFYTLKEAKERLMANRTINTPNAKVYIMDKIKHYIKR